MLVAFILTSVSCVTEPPAITNRNSNAGQAADNAGPGGVTARVPALGSDGNPHKIEENKFKKATFEVFWPTDEIENHTGTLTVYLKDSRQVPTESKSIRIGRRHGRLGRFTLISPTGDALKELYYNLPDPDWDVVVVDDPDYDSDLDNDRKLTILFVPRCRESRPGPMAGGSFTTPIGFTVVLSVN